MELESKTGGPLSDVDIDAMFSSGSVEEFMQSISKKGIFSAEDSKRPEKSRTTQDAMDVIQTIMSGKKVDERASQAKEAPKLQFDKEEAELKEAG